MRTLQLLLLILVAASWNPFMVEVDEVRDGNSLLKDKEYKKAEEKYKKAQESRASELRLKFNLGLTYMGLAQWADAEREMIAATGSDDAEMRKHANYFSGIIRFHLGDIAKNNKDPKNPAGHIKQAETKYREALDNFKRVLEVDPKNDEARFNFELTLERIEELEQERDQQQKKKEQEEKKKQKQKDKKDNKKKDPNKQNDKKNQKKDDPSKDKKDQKKQNKKNDPNKKDQKKNDPNKKDQKKNDQKKQDPKKQKSNQKKDPKKQNSKNKPQPRPSKPKKKQTPQQRAARKALRDLKERQRQRMKELYRRQGAGRRTPIKDW